MGIISGFVKGAGNAAFEMGKMTLADKLAKERDEANFLRDSQLRTDMQDKRLAHLSGENDKRTAAEKERDELKVQAEKDRDAEKVRTDAEAAETKTETDKEAAKALGEVNKEVARIRSTTSSNKLSEKEKNAAALIEKGYPSDIANGVAFNAIQEIKDADTGDMFLVNTLTNTKIGTMTTVNGKPTYIPEGDTSNDAQVTAAHKTLATKRMNERAGTFRSDDTDFPETEGDRKAWRNQEAQRIANAERDEANKADEKVDEKVEVGGIVESETGAETKQFGMKSYTFEEFSAAMKKTHGAAATPQALQETWDSIGKK